MRILFLFILCIWILLGCNNHTPKAQEKNIKSDSDITQQQTVVEKIKTIDSILKYKNKNTELLHQKAQYFLKLSKQDSAIIYFKQALKTNPKHIPTLLALSYMYAEEGDIQCLSLIKSLLQQNKKNKSMIARGNYILGVYHTIIKEHKKATAYFDACIKNDWTFIEAYLEKGILFLQNKNTQEALSIFLLATKVNNKHAESYYWVGRTLEELKNLQDAKKYYKQSLLFDKNLNVAKQRLQNIENKK